MNIKHIIIGILLTGSFSCYNALDEVYKDTNLNPAVLAGLEVYPGTLSPVFDSDKTAYSVSVPAGYTSATVTPRTDIQDAKLRYSIGGAALNSCESGGGIEVNGFTYERAGILKIEVALGDRKAKKEYTVSIRKESRTWGTASLVETDNAGTAQSPQIAFDSAGNAIAVWQQNDGARFNIWANRYVSGSGWGTAARIDISHTGSAQIPQIAIDSAGNAIAVWQQDESGIYYIWANRYVPGTGWGTAARIDTSHTGSAYSPQIAFDSAGNAIAVWNQSDGSAYNIYANRYVSGTGAWETAAVIDSSSETANYPQIAIDSAGNAIAVWQQYFGTTISIEARRYDSGTGLWGTALLIETDDAGNASSPQIAVDSAGNAIAVWNQYDGTRYNIWANRYDSGTGLWGTALLIETDDAGNANSPQIAVDSAGNAVAVWNQYDGTRHNIYANRFVPGTGWTGAALIETDNAGSAIKAQIAFDSTGNAFAVWQQNDGIINNIYANSYVSGTGWVGASLLETYAGDATEPQIAFDSTGNAIAVWQQNDGTRNNIRANRFE